MSAPQGYFFFECKLQRHRVSSYPVSASARTVSHNGTSVGQVLVFGFMNAHLGQPGLPTSLWSLRVLIPAFAHFPRLVATQNIQYLVWVAQHKSRTLGV